MPGTSTIDNLREKLGNMDRIYTKDSMVSSSIAVLVVLIAFVWTGYAYISGTGSGRMILHPIVPILLIALLLGFRGVNSIKPIRIAAIILISLWLFVQLQGVFMPFIIGFVLAYVVSVILSGLQNIPLPKGRRLRLSRGAAIAVLLVLLIGIVTFLALGVVPQLIEQTDAMKQGIANFYSAAKDYTVKVVTDLKSGEYPFKDRLPASWQTAIEGYIDKVTVYVQQKIPSTAESVSRIVGELLARLSSGFIGTMGQISSAFFIFIVFVYAIQSFRSNMEKIRDLFPAGQRQKVTRYAAEVDTGMRAFLKGQLAEIAIISTISAIAYSIIRVPFAMLVGLLAGLCNAVPTIGPVIGGAIAIFASMLGFVAGNYGLTGFLIQIALVIGAALGIQLLDSSLISPRIMSGAIEVHPLVVMFAVLLSASLIGIWGAVLAIPGVVIIKAVIKVSGEIRAEQKPDETGM